MSQSITTFQTIEVIINNGSHNVFWKNADYKVVKDKGFLVIEDTEEGIYIDVLDNTYHNIADFFALPK